jgi:hypothetical protein
MFPIDPVWFCEETQQFAVFLTDTAPDGRPGQDIRMVEAGRIRQVGPYFYFQGTNLLVRERFSARRGRPIVGMDGLKRSIDWKATGKETFDQRCIDACGHTVEEFVGLHAEAV